MESTTATKRTKADTTPTAEDSLAVGPGEPVPEEIPMNATTAPTLPAPPETDAPVTELPSSEPELTVERMYSHRKESVIAAFVHCEKLTGVTRKLTADGWKRELSAFMLVER